LVLFFPAKIQQKLSNQKKMNKYFSLSMFFFNKENAFYKKNISFAELK
jgi:hypothetical protein